MAQNELERRIAELRTTPPLLLCRTPEGKERIMTLGECRRTGSTYIHIVADDLDDLLTRVLAAELNRAEWL